MNPKWKFCGAAAAVLLLFACRPARIPPLRIRRRRLWKDRSRHRPLPPPMRWNASSVAGSRRRRP